MSTKPEAIIAEAIERAEIVDHPLDCAIEKAAANPGWPFLPEVLSCLADLRHQDAAAFEKLRAGFKLAGVRVAELDKYLSYLSRLGSGSRGRRRDQTELLLELAEDMELFHSSDKTAYADIIVDGHQETWAVRSKGFEHHLQKRFYDMTSNAPRPEAWRTAVDMLETRARFDGPEQSVYVRVASFERELYVDLGRPDWRAIRITPKGWELINDPPVRFRRSAGMKPLPEPEPRGSIELLKPFLNLRSEQDFVLVVAWLLAAIRHPGPYPVLALAGEHGSAKSTCAAILRELIDPNSTGARAMPRDERDIFIAAKHGHLLAFDNLSDLPVWFSDCLCRLATGGGHAVRRLYTDEEEILFKAQRPIILNGIEDLVTRPDLADRTIFITLEPITRDRRRSEQELWSNFTAERPRILGALLDIAAHGLRTLPDLTDGSWPRMADFARWVTACEGALGPRETFQSAYDCNREEIMQNAIEADSVALAVGALMGARTMRTMRTQISATFSDKTAWEGTATALLRDLEAISEDDICRHGNWPKTTNALSNRLRRAAPFLRERGLEISFARKGQDRTRIIRISVTSDDQQRPTPCEAEPHKAPAEEAEVTIEQTETEVAIDGPPSACLLTSPEGSSASSASSAPSTAVPLKSTEIVVPKPVPKAAGYMIAKPKRYVVPKPSGNVVPKRPNVVPKPQRAG